ncbi:MAG: ABC transporter substrate-binding protein [Candidatus Marinarcus sp.]|uniref:ABC transporter substrate-binding protein n=1 Tax=Candidatus Marinarcus sp. TaxID=3100987 RepID=UPI003AFF6E44
MRKILIFLLILGAAFAKESITVFGASPPATYLLYSIDPTVISGTNYTFKDKELKYLNQNMNALPVIGGWFGQGKTPNFETLIKVNPDLILTWNYKNSFKSVDEKLHSLGFKTLGINIDTLKDYVSAYQTMGKVLSLQSRTDKLSEYTQNVLNELEALRKNIKKKKVVYYAEGIDGLQTECYNSIHADLIEYIGGYNPHRCENKTGFGRDRITLEQLLLYNPDIIITQEEAFYNSVYTQNKFQNIRAVKNKAVYLIPSEPFSWFDRPPSFMKILGAQWLGNLVYKEIYSIDITKRVKAFYELFLNVSLEDVEIKNLLEGKE